jgi:hypothetical protein
MFTLKQTRSVKIKGQKKIATEQLSLRCRTRCLQGRVSSVYRVILFSVLIKPAMGSR